MDRQLRQMVTNTTAAVQHGRQCT